MHAEVVDGVLVVSGPDLDQVLAVVGDRLGPDAEVIDAQRAIVGGIGGFFGREEFTVQARVPDVAAASVSVAPVPVSPAPVLPLADTTVAAAPPAATTDTPQAPLNGATFAAALAEALAEVDEVVGTVAPVMAPDSEPVVAPESGPVVEPVISPELALDDVHTNLTAAAFDLLHDDEPVAPVAAIAARVGAEPVWNGAPILALTAAELTDDQLRAHLTELVGTPPVLPLHGVVAVVGDPADAIATAELLATRGGLDPADVLVVAPTPVEGRPSWLTVTDPADAARRRARWGSSKRLTVVAVALNPGLDGLQWARTMLDALDSHQVRLAVAGWRHLDEVVPRLRGLQRVDAIDLCSPVDPTAASGFLGLPVPVGLLAGRPATVDAWVDHLRPTQHAVRPAVPVDATAEDVLA